MTRQYNSRDPLTLDSFAELFPLLFRIAVRGAHAGIRLHGLLPASEVARRSGVALPQAPRAEALPLVLPDGTEVVVTDNRPLSFEKLRPVLDDGLTPEEWLSMLNDRVFFWPSKAMGEGNLTARRGLGYESEWQVYDTKRLLDGVFEHAEIAPFNTGATLYNPVRRGHATFAKVSGMDFQGWRRARGLSSLDVVKEVSVLGCIPNAGAALVEVVPA